MTAAAAAARPSGGHKKAVLWGVATKAATFILFYALQIYLVRTAGIEAYGRWNYFYSAFTIIAVLANFGIQHSARKHLAQFAGREGFGAVVKSSLRLRALFSGLFAALMLLSAGPLAAALGRPELRSLFLWAAPMVFFTGFVEYFKEFFIGLRRIDRNLLINSCEYGAKLLLTAVLFGLTASLSGVAAAFAFALLVAACAGLWNARGILAEGPGGGVFGRTGFSLKLLAYALPMFMVEALNMAAGNMDTLILGYLAGDKAVGLYSIPKQIAIKAPHISMAICMGIMPVFAQFESARAGELKALFRKLLLANAVIAGSIVAVIMLFAGKLLGLLYGPASVQAAPAFRVLCLYIAAATFSVYFASFLEYRGFAAKLARNIVIAFVVEAGLCLLLAPRYGALGAAWALSGAWTLFLALNVLSARKAFLLAQRD